LRKEIASKVSQINIQTIADINVVTGTNAEIMKIPNEIPPDTQSSILNQVDTFLEMLNNGDVSADLLQESLSGVMNMASKVAQASSNVVDVVNENDTDVMALKSLIGDVETKKDEVYNLKKTCKITHNWMTFANRYI